MGITEAGPGGAFYLFDAAGKQLAKVSKLSDYRHVFSEPKGPLIVSRPTGGWAGWPSLWKANGSRSEAISKGWPEGHAVAMVHFSPDGKAMAVLSKLEPTNYDFTISVYSPTGSLVWRAQTPTEAEWTAASIIFSKSGKYLAAASRTRLRVYDRKGQVVMDQPITTTSDRYIRFSSDEKKVVLSLGDAAQIFDIASGSTAWNWSAKSLQDSGTLPAGRLYVSRLDCSQDCKTVILSGNVADWEQALTEHGEPTRVMVVRTEFFAVLREGVLFDLVKLPPNTLLGDFSESLGTSKAIAVSGSGSNILVPSHKTTFQYEAPQR
jgi:WD40 repeat protein